MNVYILMSNAGRVVSVYSDIPTQKQCDEDYSSYLNKVYQLGISIFNCWLEEWIMDKGSQRQPKVIKPKV